VVLRSHRKRPQAIVLQGQNHGEGRELDAESYEQTMLEMVNAF
jgi:hypothetical protein